MHRLKRRPLTEAEAEYNTQQASESSWFTHNEVCIKAGVVQPAKCSLSATRQSYIHRAVLIGLYSCIHRTMFIWSRDMPVGLLLKGISIAQYAHLSTTSGGLLPKFGWLQQ